MKSSVGCKNNTLNLPTAAVLYEVQRLYRRPVTREAREVLAWTATGKAHLARMQGCSS